MLANAVVSALINLVIAGIPTGIYWAVQRRKHQRSHQQILGRIGFRLPNGGHMVGLALLLLASGWIVFRFLTTPIDVLANEGSPLVPFVGAEVGFASVGAAFLYGCIQTGLAEEWLFRGLIAGALGRRLALWKANIIQALLFTGIHLPILFFVPDEWVLILVVPTALGLAAGWMRIKTDSLLWPWAIHGGTNFLLALLVLLGT